MSTFDPPKDFVDAYNQQVNLEISIRALNSMLDNSESQHRSEEWVTGVALAVIRHQLRIAYLKQWQKASDNRNKAALDRWSKEVPNGIRAEA